MMMHVVNHLRYIRQLREANKINSEARKGFQEWEKKKAEKDLTSESKRV